MERGGRQDEWDGVKKLSGCCDRGGKGTGREIAKAFSSRQPLLQDWKKQCRMLPFFRPRMNGVE